MHVKPRKTDRTVKATAADLMTFIQAAHVSQDTDWNLDSRGGIMLVSYPEGLKTSIVERALRHYPEARIVSDMNVREFSDVREDLITQRYDTIAFLDYQKVWERDDRTSANVEGVIRALTDEGWRGTLGGKDIRGALAKCFMVLCMTPHLYNSKTDQWNKTGFMRRFLVMTYLFTDRKVLEESILEGRKYQLSTRGDIPRPSNVLPYNVSTNERQYIKLALKEQKGLVNLQLLLRIYNTLKWFFDEVQKENDRGMQLLMSMIPMFLPEGGQLTVQQQQGLEVVNSTPKQRERKAQHA